jgi:hypothetical protein
VKKGVSDIIVKTKKISGARRSVFGGRILPPIILSLYQIQTLARLTHVLHCYKVRFFAPLKIFEVLPALLLFARANPILLHEVNCLDVYLECPGAMLAKSWQKCKPCFLRDPQFINSHAQNRKCYLKGTLEKNSPSMDYVAILLLK